MAQVALGALGPDLGRGQLLLRLVGPALGGEGALERGVGPGHQLVVDRRRARGRLELGLELGDLVVGLGHVGRGQHGGVGDHRLLAGDLLVDLDADLLVGVVALALQAVALRALLLGVVLGAQHGGAGHLARGLGLGQRDPQPGQLADVVGVEVDRR